MNRLFIIGNLTINPELRTTQNGVKVCTFTVAVNPRNRKEKQDVQYFRVTAWRDLGELCSKWLVKGKKVAVIGNVSVNAYQGKDGKSYANLEVLAQEIEFLSPAGSTEKTPEVDEQSGMQIVTPDDDFPFE